MGISCICCMYAFTVIQYESVHLQMYLTVYVIYKCFRKNSVCIYCYCMQIENCMWHSSVGYWVCYIMFNRENERVLWRSVSRHG
jgi:hypothetical protein